MAQSFGQKLSSQPQVAAFTTARSLLLVSSSIVRKCKKESMMAKFKQRMVKWGLSAGKQQYLFSGIMALSVLATVSSVAQAHSIEGPSSSQSPYVIRSISGVVTKSILTVGDSVNNKPDGTPYRLVGIPDGLGAFDNGDETFTLLVNHELPGTGIVRAHGSKGAFVSKWIIRKEDLTVLNGQDLIQTVQLWDPTANGGAGGYISGTTIFNRFCSADLPALSAFYDTASGLGYSGHIYMNGEEINTVGRNFAHLMDGTSYELPSLGKFAHENSVANPATGHIPLLPAWTTDQAGRYISMSVPRKTEGAQFKQLV
jgi:hypothetical protein